MKMHSSVSMLFCIGVFCLFSCTDSNQQYDETDSPSVKLNELINAIAETDTFVFDVKNAESLSKIVIDFTGVATDQTYSFVITKAPYILVLDPALFKSDDYKVSITVKDKNGKTVSGYWFGTVISNPDEDDLVIAPIYEGNYDRVWVAVEDIDLNVVYCSLLRNSSTNRVQIPGDKKPEVKCYNLHFIFESDPPPENDNVLCISNIFIKSIFHFKGRYFAPEQFHLPIYDCYIVDFRFKNIPEHNEFHIHRPSLNGQTETLEGNWNAIINRFEPEFYIYTRLNDKYNYKYIPNQGKVDSVIDLGEMKEIGNFHTIETNGTAPTVSVNWLKENIRDIPKISLFEKSAQTSTSFIIPMPDVFSEKPFYETIVDFKAADAIDHEYVFIGSIPANVDQQNIDFDIVSDNKTVEISTPDEFDYFKGKKEFNSWGTVYWSFISDNKKVSLPDFPELLFDDIPELKYLVADNDAEWISWLSVVKYSNYKDYQDLLSKWDMERFEPTDYGEYNLFTFTRFLTYYNN